MSITVGNSELRLFVQNKMADDKLDYSEAVELEIDEIDFLEADSDSSLDLDIDEIFDNANLYDQFATMYIQEFELTEAKDNEEEAEETDERRLSDKSEAQA